MILRTAVQPTYDPALIQRRLRRRNPGVGERILEAIPLYFAIAPTRGLRWDFPVAQFLLETGNGTSRAFVRDRNTAGVKDPTTGQYRAYDRLEDGIVDHLNLLGLYTGLVWVPDEVDPTRRERLPAVIRRHLEARDVDGRDYIVDSAELNGLWAVPGEHYAENIERVRFVVFDDPRLGS